MANSKHPYKSSSQSSKSLSKISKNSTKKSNQTQPNLSTNSKISKNFSSFLQKQTPNNNVYFSKAVFSRKRSDKKKSNVGTQTKSWKYGEKIVSHSVTQTENQQKTCLAVVIHNIKDALTAIADPQFDSLFDEKIGYKGFEGEKWTLILLKNMCDLENLTFSTPDFTTQNIKEQILLKLRLELNPSLKTSHIGKICYDLERKIINLPELKSAITFYAKNINFDHDKHGF